MAGVGEEEGIDLLLQLHLQDGTVAGEYRLVPWWESCPPVATGGSAAAVAGDVTASSTPSEGAVLPIAPPPPDTEMVTLMITRGILATHLSLVPCPSKLAVHEMKSIEGKFYLNLEVNPVNCRAVVRFYDLDQGSGSEGTLYLCSASFTSSSNSFAVKEVDQRNVLVREVHSEPSL